MVGETVPAARATHSSFELEELLAEWNGLHSDDSDDGLTLREIKIQLKCGNEKARRMLYELNDASKLAIGWRYTADITGHAQKVPVYRLREKET